jgi:hypothetical protein
MSFLRTILIKLFLLVCMVSAIPFPACAEEPQLIHSDKIPLSLLQKVPQEQQELVKGQILIINEFLGKYANRDNEKAVRRGKDLALYIRGDEGIDFPSPEELSKETDDFAQQFASAVNAGIEKEYASAPPPEIPSPVPVRTCSNSETKKTLIPKDSSKKRLKKGTFYDVLILRKEDLPEKPLEVFGKRTIINLYDRSGDDFYSTSLRYASDFIPCIPYRVRITDRFQFTHFGKDALRNYDSNVNGPGKLSSKVKQIVKKEGW